MVRWLLVFLCAQSALGVEREFHVSITGDDANPGTELLPFKTVQRAADFAESGDIVVIHGGVYTQPAGRSRVLEISHSGSDDAPITFTSAGDGEVILDSEGGGDWVVYLNGRFKPLEHIIVNGLTVRGGVSGGIYVRNTSAATVERCRAIDNHGIGVYVGGGGTNQIVRRCEVARNWIGIKAGNNLLIEQPANVTFEENWAHHNVKESYPADSDGIQMLGRGNTHSVIRGNVVCGNGDDGIDVGMEASDCLVAGNVVFNHVHPQGDGSGIKIGTHESYLRPSGGHIVRGNLIVNSRGRNLDIAGNYRVTEKGLRPPPTLVIGNTCLEAGADSVYVEMADVVFINNVVSASKNPAMWSCRLRSNDAMKDDPCVVWSDWNIWGNRWIKVDDGSLLTTQDEHSTDAVPPYQAWSVKTDLRDPQFGRASGRKIGHDGCDATSVLKDLATKPPRESWRKTLQRTGRSR